MKNIILIILFFPTIFYAYVFPKTYKVVIHKDWKPYYFVENGNPNGYAIELFNAIAKESNIKFEYIIIDNWKYGQKLIKEGKADIIPNLGITQKRADTYFFTQPTDTFSINLFKRKDSFNIISNTDIKNSRLGVVEGNVCSRLNIVDEVSQIKKYKKFTMALNDLLSGDIDAFCYPKPLLDFKLEELNLEDKIISFGLPIVELKRGIGISKENFELITVFDEVITSLKVNGEYQKIYSKWFSPKKSIEFTPNQLMLLGFGIVLFFIMSIFLLFYFSNRKKWLLTNTDLQNEVDKKTKDLLKLSTIDTLTKVYNRKKLDEIVSEQIKINKRETSTFSLIMIDIDFFKQVNDEYGHIIGDEVLVEFSKIIKHSIREIDYFGRWGGEEFLIIAPFIKDDEVLIMMERIKETIQRHVFSKGIQKTASFGITKYKDSDSLLSIIQRADEALYEAKRIGRNKIVCKY